MKAAVTSFTYTDPEAVLDRHAYRRSTGVPTVSLLVGPIGAGGGTWRRWATARGRSIVVAMGNRFPCVEWLRSLAEQVDLPGAAVQRLAQRAGRDPDVFLASWQVKTRADRERFWSTLAPDVDDDLLREMAMLALNPGSPTTVSNSLSRLGENIVSTIVRLVPSAMWPSILFVSRSTNELSYIGDVAAKWAMRTPAVPVAVAVPTVVWDEFLTTTPESRAKAILKEGEVSVPAMDAATVNRTLTQAGASGNAAAAVAANGADPALVEAALAAVRTTLAPPANEIEDDRARSAAERFLFEFLESFPETAGRFELNATLDFRFGSRAAEVDLLCRDPRIAIELDGYFHFLKSDGYRRDRSKDWELQRRGFVVLRFLAEDVIPQLEAIRDRILEAMNVTQTGANP